METDESTPHDALLRAIRLAATDPDPQEALDASLAEAVAVSGASGGALVEREGARLRAVAGCPPAVLHPLLRPGGAVSEALARQEEWIHTELLLPARGAADGPALLLVPMQARGMAVGALLLLLQRGASAGEAGTRVRALAGLAGLILDHAHHLEEARTARQAREHFFTALNHEIRTPATGLMLYADLLQAEGPESLPPRVGRMLGQVMEYLNTIIRLLDGALALGEREAEDAAGGEEVIQPRQFVRELLLRVEPAANRKRLPISFHSPPTLPPLQTDPRKLAKILLHLLNNAIKYTAEGGIEVRLEHTPRTGRHRRGPVLEVRVRDTGRGIPPEEMERIMEPFAQVDEGARSDTRSRGLGLGLSVARRLARSLGGELTLESAPGKGTTALLAVPYRR